MYLLFDIGGTKIRIGSSSDGKTIAANKIIDTPQSYKEGLDVIRQVAQELLAGQFPAAIGGGVAGVFNRTKTTLLSSPHLTDWIQKPLHTDLAREFECPVFLENDAAIVGLGEATAGAGLGYHIVGYITVSTGVGGAKIVDGKIDPHSLGFEVGHQVVESTNGEICPGCNIPGHLEAYVSGSALEKRYGKPSSEIDDPEVWDNVCRYLAIGITNATVHWSPDIIVLGGGVMQNVEIVNIERHLPQYINVYTELPALSKATLGDMSGLHGALEFIQQKLM
jgi:predicted NBD/HSP70 family sugar kinase